MDYYIIFHDIQCIMYQIIENNKNNMLEAVSRVRLNLINRLSI